MPNLIFFMFQNLSFPSKVESYDGYLLTGSPVSVHDNFDWIKMLSEFIGKSKQKK